MRALPLLVLTLMACPERATPPAPPKPALREEPRDGSPCVIPALPAMPVVEDPQRCAELGGTWVDRWEPGVTKGLLSRAPDGGTLKAKVGWQVLGRGNRRFRGCTGLPAPDRGAACDFDFQCLGRCVSGACAAVVEPKSGLGCGPHCIDGVLVRRCFE
jgi:hypothetical protein